MWEPAISGMGNAHNCAPKLQAYPPIFSLTPKASGSTWLQSCEVHILIPRTLYSFAFLTKSEISIIFTPFLCLNVFYYFYINTKMVDKPVIAEGGILLYFIFRQISILNIDFVFLLYPNFSKTLHLNPSIFPFLS